MQVTPDTHAIVREGTEAHTTEEFPIYGCLPLFILSLKKVCFGSGCAPGIVQSQDTQSSQTTHDTFQACGLAMRHKDMQTPDHTCFPSNSIPPSACYAKVHNT
jgi:hypothetical protein